MTLLLLFASYLFGSIPTGLILCRLAGGGDIRRSGSGNIGATNVYRTVGRKIGVLTLVGDALKGLLPVLVARRLGVPPEWVAAAGFAAFIGHIYTVFLGFKGGKGVATALGVFAALAPAAVGIAVVLFIATVAATRYVSLGSIVAAAAMPFLVALFDRSVPLVAATAGISLLVIWKHRENIARLRAGTENRFRA